MKINLYLSLLILSISVYNQEPKKHFTYLALGDSYTIGERVEEKERYPKLLVDSLEKSGFISDTSIIIAKTGWTTDELNNGIQTSGIDGKKFDVVTLLIGVNNQYRGRDTANYRNEFSMLLNKAIVFANNKPEKVIVLSIPDWGVTPFAAKRDIHKISKEIDFYNAINKEVSLTYKVNYIDITDISREAPLNNKLIAADGLHPSGMMYKLWLNRLYPITKNILLNNN